MLDAVLAAGSCDRSGGSGVDFVANSVKISWRSRGVAGAKPRVVLIQGQGSAEHVWDFMIWTVAEKPPDCSRDYWEEGGFAVKRHRWKLYFARCSG